MKAIDFFKREIDKLDISPTNYKLAVDRYKAVGSCIEDYLKKEFGLDVHIYPQGSFKIGTVTYPADRDDGYDIDLVCEVQEAKCKIAPRKLKELVGQALKSDSVYAKMIDKEGRRCWTIIYKEQNGIKFHIDILPSVPENIEIVEDTSIATTTRIKEGNIIKEYVWDSTDPLAFAQWYDNIKKKSYDSIQLNYRTFLYESNKNIYASVDDVPKELVKTKLQKIIQILKRHRDIRFVNSHNKDAKPMSMIITTLVATIYERVNIEHEDIMATIKKIVEELAKYKILIEHEEFVANGLIQKVNGEWKIQNPVADENLADRWHEDNNKKAKAFFQWITWLEKDMVNIDERQLNENMDLMDYFLRDEALDETIPSIEIDRETKPWRKL